VGLLVIDDEFLAVLLDDQNTDGTRALVESLLDLLWETTLGDDLDGALDLTAVGDGNQGTIFTSIDDLVLLESRSDHGVQDNAWRWVGDDARLLAKLMGEQVNTEVSVLASLR